MAQSPLGEQFHGATRLARMSLGQLALSDNVDLALANAVNDGVIGVDEASFLRRCMAMDAALDAGETTPADLSYDQIAGIQRCIAKLRAGRRNADSCAI